MQQICRIDILSSNPHFPSHGVPLLANSPRPVDRPTMAIQSSCVWFGCHGIMVQMSIEFLHIQHSAGDFLHTLQCTISSERWKRWTCRTDGPFFRDRCCHKTTPSSSKLSRMGPDSKVVTWPIIADSFVSSDVSCVTLTNIFQRWRLDDQSVPNLRYSLGLEDIRFFFLGGLPPPFKPSDNPQAVGDSATTLNSRQVGAWVLLLGLANHMTTWWQLPNGNKGLSSNKWGFTNRNGLLNQSNQQKLIFWSPRIDFEGQ